MTKGGIRGGASTINDGIHGRLRWSDLQRSPGLVPPGTPADAFAEWVVEMPEQGGNPR